MRKCCSSEKVCSHLFSWLCLIAQMLFFLQYLTNVLFYECTLTVDCKMLQGGENLPDNIRDLEQKPVMKEYFISEKKNIYPLPWKNFAISARTRIKT